MTARVLVVDDIPANVKLLEAKLGAEYFDVVTAGSGPEALTSIDAEKPDIVLLDNMSPAMLREAVARRNALAPAVELEASGGVTLETVGEIARTGVERISVGALTHSATALDIGLDWRPTTA